MRPRTVGFQILLLLISSSCFLPLAAEPSTEIPFKLYGGFAIVVRGDIGDHKNLNFLVDTGAVPSVVHQRLARTLNLRGASEVISVVNENRSVERVALPLIRIGPLDFPTVSAVVVDLTPIESRLGIRLDAIIGLDVLGGQNFTIDYRQRKLLIGIAGVAGQAVPFELQMEAGAPFVVVHSEMNSQSVRLLLDTGSDGLTLFAAHMHERMPFFEKTIAGKDVNASGEYAVQHVRISDLRLGGITQGKPQAAMISSAASALRDFDGLLGPASIGITRIAFDFNHRILYLEVNR
jgi:predicted aspartyl protease